MKGGCYFDQSEETGSLDFSEDVQYKMSLQSIQRFLTSYITRGRFSYSFSSLSHDRSKASSKASSPHSSI
jgi:hypothetical protein